MPKIRVNARGQKPTRESAAGSACSGANLTTNRVWTLGNTTLTKNETVWVGGFVMTPNVDYAITHNNTGSQVAFTGIIQDAQRLEALYFT